MLGLETVLFSLFLPSRNHNLHAGITSRMVRCNACMSLRFGSGWLVIYFWICSCTFILNIRLRVAYFAFSNLAAPRCAAPSITRSANPLIAIAPIFLAIGFSLGWPISDPGLLRATISAQRWKAGGGVFQGALPQAPGTTTRRQRAAARLFRC